VKSDGTRRIDRRRLYAALGHPGDKLPRDFRGEFEVPVYAESHWVTDAKPWATLVITVVPTPKTGRKSSKHRTFVRCECCRDIPTGRYFQHHPYCPSGGVK
jgi:hypothetical protein